jgi:hypothetical protein
MSSFWSASIANLSLAWSLGNGGGGRFPLKFPLDLGWYREKKCSWFQTLQHRKERTGFEHEFNQRVSRHCLLCALSVHTPLARLPFRFDLIVTPYSKASAHKSDTSLVRDKNGCITCRVRQKVSGTHRFYSARTHGSVVQKCAGITPGESSCTDCRRLNIQCLGVQHNRPDWLRNVSTPQPVPFVPRLTVFPHIARGSERDQVTHQGEHTPAFTRLSQLTCPLSTTSPSTLFHEVVAPHPSGLSSTSRI